jgi:hypothetical protein
MDPRDFLIVAQEMLARGGAAGFRTAVNRAYYAAYNVGVAILADEGVYLAPDTRAHADLREFLRRSGDRMLARVSTELGTLHRQRKRADYDIRASDVEGRSTAEAAVQMARRLIRNLEEFSGQDPASKQPAVEAMRRFAESPGRSWGG